MYEGQRRNLEQARIVARDLDPDRARVGRESLAYYRKEVGKVERELFPRRADANEWVRSPDVARAVAYQDEFRARHELNIRRDVELNLEAPSERLRERIGPAPARTRRIASVGWRSRASWRPRRSPGRRPSGRGCSLPPSPPPRRRRAAGAHRELREQQGMEPRAWHLHRTADRWVGIGV